MSYEGLLTSIMSMRQVVYQYNVPGKFLFPAHSLVRPHHNIWQSIVEKKKPWINHFQWFQPAISWSVWFGNYRIASVALGDTRKLPTNKLLSSETTLRAGQIQSRHVRRKRRAHQPNYGKMISSRLWPRCHSSEDDCEVQDLLATKFNEPRRRICPWCFPVLIH